MSDKRQSKCRDGKYNFDLLDVILLFENAEYMNAECILRKTILQLFRDSFIIIKNNPNSKIIKLPFYKVYVTNAETVLAKRDRITFVITQTGKHILHDTKNNVDMFEPVYSLLPADDRNREVKMIEKLTENNNTIEKLIVSRKYLEAADLYDLIPFTKRTPKLKSNLVDLLERTVGDNEPDEYASQLFDRFFMPEKLFADKKEDTSIDSLLKKLKL